MLTLGRGTDICGKVTEVSSAEGRSRTRTSFRTTDFKSRDRAIT
jgi:hypothetical protein